MNDRYHVIDTPCWPRRWKVESTLWPGRNNSWTEYFVDKREAQREADDRNAAARTALSAGKE